MKRTQALWSEAIAPLRAQAAAEPPWAWLEPLLVKSEALLMGDRHGDLPRWRAAIEALPETHRSMEGQHRAPQLGRAGPPTAALHDALQQLHPWRKGPWQLAGQHIDSEWRSDWKWARLAPHLKLQGHRVLDVGCGNGYFGWRMLAHGAEQVLGVDPTLLFVMQWLACRHFSGAARHVVLPLGVEALPRQAPVFDTVLSMGVLYHRRDPVRHLRHLRALTRPGGQVVLETLVLGGDEDGLLVPEGRYARMRNVWGVPGLQRLRAWLAEAGLAEAQLLDISPTSTDEQRSTDWMRFESLAQCLDSENPGLTIEGHPAPLRAVLLCPNPGVGE